MFTKFASYKVPPVMVSTHGSVVPLAMFFSLLLQIQMSVFMSDWSLPDGLYYNDAGLPEVVFQRKGKVCKDLHRLSR